MKALCYAIFACAFNLLLGYTGLLSFGHAAYLGARPTPPAGWCAAPAGPPELGLLAGTGVAALLGLVVGLIAIRRQGIYFAMITLAMAQMIYFVCLQAPFTGGEDGLQGVPRGKLFGLLPMDNDVAMYYLVLAVFVAVFLFILRIVHSPYGQVLKAIRENEPRAISLGYDVDRYKLLAFVLSTALAAWPARSRPRCSGFATLTDVHWSLSGEVILMTLLGGLGTFAGPGGGRLHHHRPAELPRRPCRLVGHRDHRRHLRRLRDRLPARLRRRTARLAAAAQGLRLQGRSMASRFRRKPQGSGGLDRALLLREHGGEDRQHRGRGVARVLSRRDRSAGLQPAVAEVQERLQARLRSSISSCMKDEFQYWRKWSGSGKLK
jgi:branched-chain amino acid transport system permease protein